VNHQSEDEALLRFSEVRLPQRSIGVVDIRARSALVAAGRSNAVRSREVRNVGSALSESSLPGDKLTWHPVDTGLEVIGREVLSRAAEFSEVRRSADCGCSVNRRQ